MENSSGEVQQQFGNNDIKKAEAGCLRGRRTEIREVEKFGALTHLSEQNLGIAKCASKFRWDCIIKTFQCHLNVQLRTV